MNKIKDKTTFQLFLQVLEIIFLPRQYRRKKKEAEEVAKKIIDKKFMQSTKDLAQEFYQMNQACRKQYPTKYITKMQPYFALIQNAMKESNCGPIEAAMSLVTPKTKKSDIVWIYCTASEIVNNLKPEKSK